MIKKILIQSMRKVRIFKSNKGLRLHCIKSPEVDEKGNDLTAG